LPDPILLRVLFVIKRLIPFALIALIALLLYFPGLGGPFLLDDYPNVVNNTALHIGTGSFSSLREAAFSSNAGPLHRPVAMLSFALNYYFDGLSPLYYKAVNIGIHLATAIALFFLTEALLRRLAVYQTASPKRLSTRQLAALITALWALHPLHVSTVLYVVQRMTELAALFSVIGALLYVRGREMLIANKPRGGIILIALGAVGCGSLAALSKENGALLPVLLLVVEALFFRGTRTNQPLAKLVFILLALQTAAIFAYLFYVWAGPPNPLREFTSTQRLLTETRILFSYAGQILVPRIEQMTLLGENIAVSRGLLKPLSTAAAVIAMLALISGALWAACRNRATALVFGIGWFLAGHLLESTVIPLELRFEHRNYLPSYGIIFAVGVLLNQWRPFENARPGLKFALLAGLLISLSMQLHTRVTTWATPQNFFTHELESNPDSERAWSNFAYFLFLTDKLEASLPFLFKAAELNPREAGQLITVLQIQTYELRREPDNQLVQEALLRLEHYPLTTYGQECLIRYAETALLHLDSSPRSLAAAGAILSAAARKNWNHPNRAKWIARVANRVKEKERLLQK